MRIRARLHFAHLLVLVALLITIGLSFWSLGEYSRLHDTIETGVDLVADARRVHVLMKDLVIGVFTPRTYGVLKDVVHLESLASTRRFWLEESEAFQSRFREFMRLPRLTKMISQDAQLQSQYQVANRLGEEAFSMMHSLETRLQELERTGALGTEGLYQQIQRSNDPAMIAVFNEVRETSFFLSNTFESFLHHFTRSLKEQSAVLQRRVALIFVVLATLVTCLSLLFPHFVSARIISNVQSVAGALRNVATGDFSVELNIRSNDEFEQLAKDFNSFVADLSGNVSAMVGLQRRLQEIAAHEADAHAVHQVVTDTLVRQGASDWAAIIVCEQPGGVRVLAASGPVPEAIVSGGCADEYEFVQAIPFEVPSRLSASFVVGREDGSGPFNDLQRTSLRAYAEFAALVVENHYSYAELIERRNAQFEALEAQIRPHFLYNVLNNIVGLNRRGERERIEQSILSLKDLLRHSLDSRDFVTLREEFHIGERYCELQKLRFDSRLSYEFSLPDELAEMHVPTLIVQPLLENAIIHGIEPKGSPGRVFVRAYVNEGRLYVSVADDGVGFTPTPIARSTHIGLFSVQERLRLAYADSELSISSSPGEGATLVIHMPLREVIACAS